MSRDDGIYECLPDRENCCASIGNRIPIREGTVRERDGIRGEDGPRSGRSSSARRRTTISRGMPPGVHPGCVLQGDRPLAEVGRVVPSGGQSKTVLRWFWENGFKDMRERKSFFWALMGRFSVWWTSSSRRCPISNGFLSRAVQAGLSPRRRWIPPRTGRPSLRVPGPARTGLSIRTCPGSLSSCTLVTPSPWPSEGVL